jgi:hypothetical protein
LAWALLVILDTLPPAERLAFVLHDLFEVHSAKSPSSSNVLPRPRASLRAALAAG